MGRTVGELRLTMSGDEFTRQYIYDARMAQRQEHERLTRG